jgi:hypothetical protein
MSRTGLSMLEMAIIYQAVKDFDKSCKQLARKPKDKEAIRMMKEVKQFFNSEWFECLSQFDDGRHLDYIKDTKSKT